MKLMCQITEVGLLGSILVVMVTQDSLDQYNEGYEVVRNSHASRHPGVRGGNSSCLYRKTKFHEREVWLTEAILCPLPEHLLGPESHPASRLPGARFFG